MLYILCWRTVIVRQYVGPSEGEVERKADELQLVSMHRLSNEASGQSNTFHGSD